MLEPQKMFNELQRLNPGGRWWVLIDAAGLPDGRNSIDESKFSEVECLFTGDLADELADVAPYLALVDVLDERVIGYLHYLLQEDCAVLAMDEKNAITFSEAHRHFRKFNIVYGPQGEALFFRYYDGRTLPAVLDVLELSQLNDFFGPFQNFILPSLENSALQLTQIEGKLLQIPIDWKVNSG